MPTNAFPHALATFLPFQDALPPSEIADDAVSVT
jgi:hypothetical protein